MAAKTRNEHDRAKRAKLEAQVMPGKQAASLEHFLDHAPEEFIRPLRELMKSGELEYMRSGELRRLEDIGAVEQLIETRLHHAVFSLSGKSEPIIRAHFEAKRAAHVRNEVSSL